MSELNINGVSRVAFDLTAGMTEAVEHILKITDLHSKPEVFRRAFTLLRIHIEAAEQGRQIYMVDPSQPNDRYIISLPFEVQLRRENSET